jgi:hypothetical protein
MTVAALLPTYQGFGYGRPAHIPNTENTENEDMCLRPHVDAERAMTRRSVQTGAPRAAGFSVMLALGAAPAVTAEPAIHARCCQSGGGATEYRRDDMLGPCGHEPPRGTSRRH